MLLQIKRKDGSVVELHNGTMRLKVQVQLFGKVEVIDPKTGSTFHVEQLKDGSFAEAAPSSGH